jgi:hypothetical protein
MKSNRIQEVILIIFNNFENLISTERDIFTNI